MVNPGASEKNSPSMSAKTEPSTPGVSDVIIAELEDDPGDEKLLRKLDWHLVPTMTVLYLLSFLDRVNIGQAKLDGLTVSLNLSSTQYNTCLSVFFITYVIFEIPSNLILKRLRPSRWIPMIMVSWGIVMTLMGLVQSYTGLLVCRLVLGGAESGLFPGASFYLSSWYRRTELSWRVSILFSAAALAGAFGGVLAYGISRMAGIGGQEGWRWIFYLEGIATVVVGALAVFLLNDFPSDRPKFLTEAQCMRVVARLKIDTGAGSDDHFSWPQVLAALSTWKIYAWSMCYIGMCVPFYSLSFFSPTIIHNLGFVTYQAQLLTAPPYVFAFFTTMITAYISDKYARRSIFIIFWLSISIVGYSMLIAVDNLVVNYIAVILAAGGLSPCIATCIAFLSGNVSPQVKKATALAFMISVGNIGGVISGQLYRTQDAPRFILGHAVNLGFCAFGVINAVILLIGLRAENRRRDRVCATVASFATLANAASVLCVTTAARPIASDLGSEEERRGWGYEHLSEKEIRNLGDEHVTWRYIL
ncbi:unnamed protein product [Rotaria socialis]|uniref:Major facilitator superfamily (MFS) profile domain-containing protein n=1 Tax=Rotaria socialis TaxID=392032 RepID=A0A821F719_9BILA|nr:unnamed protein product [Rotaria socialis]CAF3272024.1 unnamed protein product [Rotaria socialis]CAF3513356.1 unnamed protein product [Rotaria socialis]CAF3691796.1 unnamed protein product [Rotaria socialis]CAF4351076.1 unnamed protein product [Rotaria socialis]